MIEALKILLSLSLSGTLVILVLLLCRPLYRSKLSRQWQYYIWLAAVVRLLLPFTPEISPVGSLFRNADNAIVQIRTAEWPEQNIFPESDTGLAEQKRNHGWQGGLLNDGSGGDERTFVQKVSEMMTQNGWLICGLVWLTATSGLWIRKVTVYQSFVKYIRAGCVEVTDMRLWERLGSLVEQAGIKTAVGLYTNSLVSSPLLIGFFKPRIILPSAELSDSDFENTIRHELTHFKRWDMFYKWLVQITVCLHWFNPLVHLMGKEINRACEFSCDEAVIRSFDREAKQAYGDTLLNAIGVGGNYKDSLASVTLHENAELLKERLDTIMRFQKKSGFVKGFTAAITIVVGLGAALAGAYAAAPATAVAAAVPPAAANGADQPGLQDTINNSDIEVATVNDRVIREGGVYFILCEGADESDKPTAGVTDGSVAFVLVRKDGYASVGPFDDMEKLVEEVKEQSDYMRTKQSITQDEAALIVNVAEKVQSGEESGFSGKTEEAFFDEAAADEREYAQWGIAKKNDAYYYDNKRVRIIVDMGVNDTFLTLKYDKKYGSVDLRVIRDESGGIKAVEYLTQEEADEILNNLGQPF